MRLPGNRPRPASSIVGVPLLYDSERREGLSTAVLYLWYSDDGAAALFAITGVTSHAMDFLPKSSVGQWCGVTNSEIGHAGVHW